MSTARNGIQSLLQKLPDECTFEDVQYHFYAIEKVVEAPKDPRTKEQSLRNRSKGALRSRLVPKSDDNRGAAY